MNFFFHGDSLLNYFQITLFSITDHDKSGKKRDLIPFHWPGTKRINSLRSLVKKKIKVFFATTQKPQKLIFFGLTNFGKPKMQKPKKKTQNQTKKNFFRVKVDKVIFNQ